MTEQNFDVYLRFLMENKDAKEGAQELIDAYETLSKSIEELGPEFKRGSTLWKSYMQPYQDEIKKAIDGMRQLGAANEQTTKTIADQNKVVQMQITNLRRQAREITTNVRLIRDSAQDIDRFARPLAMIGTATVGGIFAFASKYVKDAKEATTVTKEWKAAQASLEKSGQEIGAVLAKEALPLLKDAAQIMDRVAGVLQKNPGIAGAALKGGLIALTLGTIGKAVAGGIRFYADLKFDAALTLQNTAAQLQLKASQNQLQAAGIQASASKTGGAGTLAKIGATTIGGATVSSLGGAAAIGAAASIALTVIGIIEARATAGLRKKMGLENVIPSAAKSVGIGLGKVFGLSDEEVERKALVFSALIGRIAGDIDKTSPLWLKAADAVKKTSDVVSDAAAELSDKDIGIAKAFGDWRTDDAKIVKDAMDARRKIVSEGEKSILDLTQRYRSQVSSISASSSRQASAIMSRYVQENIKAEEQYTRERAKIVQESGEEIRKIEADHQAELQKLAQDHNDAMGDLLASRDALGLVKEQERYDRAREDVEKGINKEISERKRETAVRLQDLAQNFAQERQERRRQFEQDLGENAKQRADQLKEAAANYAAEVRQAREATAQKLRDLAEATQQERARRREQFLGQIRDIDESLLGERRTKNEYYQAMLKDAETFMAGYRARLNLGSGAATLERTASGGVSQRTSPTSGQASSTWRDFWGNLIGSAPTRDSGGYANKGIYKMAWNGQPEFVMSNSATKAAEEMIGGQLTQERLIAALSAGAGRSVSYNDQRRFNAGISARDRRAIRDDTQQLLEGLIRG